MSVSRFSSEMAFVSGMDIGQTPVASAYRFIEGVVPAKDTLRIMIVRSRLLLGIERERGTIKRSLSADINATSENPLGNIETRQAHLFGDEERARPQAEQIMLVGWNGSPQSCPVG